MNKYLVDPDQLFTDRRRKKTEPKENLCVLDCIILKIELLRKTLYEIRRKGPLYLKKRVKCLEYESINNFQRGFEISNFSALEKLNSPLSLAILKTYSELRLYKGLGINLFRLEHNQDNRTFRFFPKKLSKHHNCPDFLQIDLLDIPRIKKNGEKKQGHCYLIRNLLKLLNAHGPSLPNPGNSLQLMRNQNYVCRGCLRIFRYKIAFERHATSCVVKGQFAANRRLNTNQYFHKTHFVDRFNNTKRRVRSFTKGDLFKRLKPLLFAGKSFYIKKQ